MVARTLIACLGCAAALGAAGPAHAAFPGPNGSVAFTGVTTVCGTNPCPRTDVWNTSGAILATGSHPAWSPDGQRLAFADGTDIYTIKPDGSDKQLVLDWNSNIESIAWAPSGDRLAAALGVCDGDECRTDIHVIDLDPSGVAQAVVDITPDLFPDNNPAWSPLGDRIAFDTTRDANNDVFTMDVDGSNLTRLTTNPAGDSDPNWAPTADALAFTSTRDGTDVIYTMTPTGAGQTRRTGLGAGVSRQPAWSPDGTYIVFSGVRSSTAPALFVITADGSSESRVTNASGRSDFEPDWQPANLGYPRPKGATPLRVSLVPSYTRCTASNRTHGPPLAFGSCNPPSQTSPNITIGTPDANGAAANATGFALFSVQPGSFPPVEADYGIQMSFSDVRCGAGTTACGPANDRAGADYTGELQLEYVVRLTDKSPAFDPKTVQDFTFGVQASCSATPTTTTGAACSVYTSANAVLPGSVRDGRRSIWQLSEVRVLDGGADGDAGTAGDNRPFATQGVFVP